MYTTWPQRSTTLHFTVFQPNASQENLTASGLHSTASTCICVSSKAGRCPSEQPLRVLSRDRNVAVLYNGHRTTQSCLKTWQFPSYTEATKRIPKDRPLRTSLQRGRWRHVSGSQSFDPSSVHAALLVDTGLPQYFCFPPSVSFHQCSIPNQTLYNHNSLQRR